MREEKPKTGLPALPSPRGRSGRGSRMNRIANSFSISLHNMTGWLTASTFTLKSRYGGAGLFR